MIRQSKCYFKQSFWTLIRAISVIVILLSAFQFAQAQQSGPERFRVLSYDIAPNKPNLYGSIYAETQGMRLVNMLGSGLESDDNGVNWTTRPLEPDFTAELPYGYRREPYASFIDTNTNRMIGIFDSLDTAGLDPNSIEPAIALREYYLRYRVSEDGGRTWLFDEPIINTGDYTQKHPFEGIQIGSNCLFLGDYGDIPIVTDSGRIIVPAQATILDESGNLYNPTGQTAYTDVFAILGTWVEQGRIEWTASPRVNVDPSLSTRGMIEPTLAQFGDGRILMVMRGSNAGDSNLPGRRWYSISQDDGENWTQPQPWTYDDGQAFHSPSSMSTLVEHSSGRIFWVGNLCEQNSSGNSPRYPVVMGEVDPNSLKLIRNSVIEIDNQRQADIDRGGVNLSHFWISEDRQTKQFVLTYPRSYNRYSSADWATVRIAEGIQAKASQDFAFKYEMDVLPSTLDLDGNSIADFTAVGTSTVSDGILNMPVDCYFQSPEDGLWHEAVNFNGGWTIEVRVKVIEQTSGDIAWELFAGAPGGNSSATLAVAQAGQGWNNGSSLGEADNADDFHVFRIVQQPGSSSYLIWRDGELIGENISDVYHVGNYLWFGDGSGGWSGTSQVDYLRITPGAFAPVKIIPGDANRDGAVDDDDAAIIAANWLTESGATWAMGDFNADGRIDEVDASLLAANWGESSVSDAVPEPGMLTLLGLAAMGLFVLPKSSMFLLA